MPYCTQCGIKLTEDARFCWQCGSPVETPAAAVPKPTVEPVEPAPAEPEKAIDIAASVAIAASAAAIAIDGLPDFDITVPAVSEEQVERAAGELEDQTRHDIDDFVAVSGFAGALGSVSLEEWTSAMHEAEKVVQEEGLES